MSKADRFHKALLKTCHLYTTNQLTLCQAANIVHNAHQDFYPQAPTLGTESILRILGHQLHTDDVYGIEHGYEGSFSAWFKEHKPVGWYQLFSDNYEQYKEPTCTKTPHAQNDNLEQGETNESV